MRYKWPVLWILCLLLTSCNGSQNAEEPMSLSVRKLPILNGVRVTGDDYLSTVALTIYGQAFCTGTLISPNYVLTAGHCISYCQGDEDNIENYRKQMRVGIGQSEDDLIQTYEIESFHPHPNFICSNYEIANDIAIIKLKKSVPISLTAPTPAMPPQYDMMPNEVDSSAGVRLTTVGFGRTSSYDDYSSGDKYRTELKVYAYCPNQRTQSRKCGTNSYVETDGFIYFNETNTGTCQGDSGGPTFMTRNGNEYVVGVTSYGYEGCASYSAVTLVSDYYDFITGIVDNMAAPEPEICDNEIDDNGDNLRDCDDPYCFKIKRCIPEICDNDVDENEDGLIDCDDPQCQEERICQPEICDNGIDDNDDGKKDCDDRQCQSALICQPEICDNQLDDNGNDLIDCSDPQCSSLLSCQPEICDDDIDNNGNQLVDCNDPQCETEPACIPENCNDNIDNNGDGLKDCADPQCRKSVYCQLEICNDNIDNNANGLMDCADPQCQNHSACQPKTCEDRCDDPECAEDEACQITPASYTSCSTAPMRHTHTPAGLISILALLGFGLRLRRKH